MKRQDKQKQDQKAIRQSYILRFWRNPPTDTWHLMLQELDGQRHTFADLTQLITFLESMMKNKTVGDEHEPI